MFCTKGENFSKYCNITKTQGDGGYIPRRGGMSLFVGPRVNNTAKLEGVQN